MSGKPTGTYCWADLLPADQPRAIAFYGELLGWSAVRRTAELPGYARATLGDAEGAPHVAGIHDAARGEVRPQWTASLAAEDLDATLEAVVAHGGSIVSPAYDVPGRGRMATCVEPTGAAFGLWQAAPFEGFGAAGSTHGAFCWAEIYSTEAAITRDFFAGAFDLEAETLADSDEFTYHQLGIPSNPEGRKVQFGVMQITRGGQFPDGMASTVRQYVSVADADASTEEAARLGARVQAPPADSPFGRVSTIVDPEGVMLNLIDLSRASVN